MNEQSVNVENVQADEAILNFESYIKRTLKYPVSRDFHTRWYCRKCGLSFDMTARLVKVLMERNPESFVNLPPGIDDLDTLENIRKCYFILEPCFVCSKNAKIKTEIRLYPSHQNGFNVKKAK